MLGKGLGVKARLEASWKAEYMGASLWSAVSAATLASWVAKYLGASPGVAKAWVI
jgi:hypothetical protein